MFGLLSPAGVYYTMTIFFFGKIAASLRCNMQHENKTKRRSKLKTSYMYSGVYFMYYVVCSSLSESSAWREASRDDVVMNFVAPETIHDGWMLIDPIISGCIYIHDRARTLLSRPSPGQQGRLQNYLMHVYVREKELLSPPSFRCCEGSVPR